MPRGPKGEKRPADMIGAAMKVTLYRIHGTTEPMSIGKNAYSGCIHMISQDVIELYRRAPIGSRVAVMTEGV
jgi:lipoprotein-anchoring transpeptidase ErfK/SrfK